MNFDKITEILSEKRVSMTGSGYTDDQIQEMLSSAFELATLKSINDKFSNLTPEQNSQLQEVLKNQEIEKISSIIPMTESDQQLIPQLQEAHLKEILRGIE